MDVDIFPKILVWLVPTLPAIVIHEYAHGWMASKLGDPTARDAGRLSLNPLRHIDPVGTIIVPCLMIFAHLPFVFGWAKPVPVNFRRLRNIRVGTMLVALAGPLSNALMTLGWLALLWIIAASAVFNSSPQAAPPLLAQIAVTGAVVNLALILFNLLPIPPLDGGRFLGAVLPQALSKPYMRLERYGILILLLLVVTGIFNRIFIPLLEFLLSHFGITGL